MKTSVLRVKEEKLGYAPELVEMIIPEDPGTPT